MKDKTIQLLFCVAPIIAIIGFSTALHIKAKGMGKKEPDVFDEMEKIAKAGRGIYTNEYFTAKSISVEDWRKREPAVQWTDRPLLNAEGHPLIQLDMNPLVCRVESPGLILESSFKPIVTRTNDTWFITFKKSEVDRHGFIDPNSYEQQRKAMHNPSFDHK